MNRRSFIQNTGIAAGAALPLLSSTKLFGANGGSAARNGGAKTAAARSGRGTPNIQVGLDPFTGTLTPALAAHLLRRTGFGPRYSEVAAVVSNGNVAQIVQSMLTATAAPTPPGPWVSTAPLLDGSNTSQTTNNTNMENFREWWMGLIYSSGFPASTNVPNCLLEKMVLFWANHFVSEYAKVKCPQYLYWQNTLHRQYAFGSFKDYITQMSIDNAMLWYLDGYTNTVGSANENYAREEMELFTMGPYDTTNLINPTAQAVPNYTQTDITNSARANTGYQFTGGNKTPQALSQWTPGTYKANLFDGSSKTYLGQTGNFGYTDIINIIFNQIDAPTQKNKVGLFICTKLYGLFVYDNPGTPGDPNYASYCNRTNPIIQAMADTFANNNFSISAVLQQLLTSQHFFDPSVIGAAIKSPVDFVVSATRQFEILNAPNSYLYQQSASFTGSGETQLDQPPNVKGFPGYETWISTASLPARNQFTDSVFKNGISGATPMDPIAFAKMVCNNDSTQYDNAYNLIKACANFLLPFTLDNSDPNNSSSKMYALSNALLNGASINDWSTSYPNAAQSIQAMLQLMCRLADFQLA
ncbi:MAG TPA: DUF1800 family protein [Candidatus Kapabacteria bacterium]|nr:DUF1800 family protein [Candidatus Kapabacteria bacterium]